MSCNELEAEALSCTRSAVVGVIVYHRSIRHGLTVTNGVVVLWRAGFAVVWEYVRLKKDYGDIGELPCGCVVFVGVFRVVFIAST